MGSGVELASADKKIDLISQGPRDIGDREEAAQGKHGPVFQPEQADLPGLGKKGWGVRRDYREAATLRSLPTILPATDSVSPFRGVAGPSLPVLSVLAGILLLTVEVQAQDVAADREALMALYNATGGPDWINDTNRLSAAPLGEWFGVVTDSDGRVRSLVLRGNGLSGAIPASLAD